MALIKERTKKRKGENVIGKIIYGFLLFAPLLAILVTCMYVTFNKNAYESYSQAEDEITDVQVNYKYETNEVNNISDLVVGNIYHLSMSLENYVSLTTWQGLQVSGIFNLDNYSCDIDLENFDTYSLILYKSTDNQISISSVIDNSEKTIALINNIQNIYTSIEFDFLYLSNSNAWFNLSTITKSTYNEIENVNVIRSEVSHLDNVFYDATKKVEESNLFNWAKETGTYTVLHTTTTGLGITNTFIPMLMAYWLLISVIYFIFDIALILIWMVHDKIHELKDSI